MSHLRSMADRINVSQGHASLWNAAMDFLPNLGLSKVIFLDLTKAGSPNILSNAGDQWTKAYTTNVKSGHDPFALNCLSQICPVLTGIGHLEAHADLDDTALGIIAQGSEALNIRTGMSVTINPHKIGAGIGWNLMADLSVAEFAQAREHHESDWRAWCQLTFAGLSMLAPHQQTPKLSPREHDCLAYVADGLRTADIAHCLCIAETTVEMHLRNARARLGAKTRDEAVALAVRAKLI